MTRANSDSVIMLNSIGLSEFYFMQGRSSKKTQMLSIIKHVAVIVVVVALASLHTDGEEPGTSKPQSAAAVAAIQKHDKDVAEAEATFKQSKVAADKTMILSLKKAQANILKTGGASSLAEANAIQHIIDTTAMDSTPATKKTVKLFIVLSGEGQLYVDGKLIGKLRDTKDGASLFDVPVGKNEKVVMKLRSPFTFRNFRVGIVGEDDKAITELPISAMKGGRSPERISEVVPPGENGGPADGIWQSAGFELTDDSVGSLPSPNEWFYVELEIADLKLENSK